MFSRGDGDLGQAIEDLSRPGARPVADWYRANLAPQLRGGCRAAAGRGAYPGHLVDRDHYLDGERMKSSADFVRDRWRYRKSPARATGCHSTRRRLKRPAARWLK